MAACLWRAVSSRPLIIGYVLVLSACAYLPEQVRPTNNDTEDAPPPAQAGPETAWIDTPSDLSDEFVGSEEDNVSAPVPYTATAVSAVHTGISPRIVTPKRRLQCVPYARRYSGIAIRGDARTWWRQAAGRFERGSTPAIGSVMVMKETRRNRLGHVAVVTRVIDNRQIVVNHANWLNRERIHLDSPVIDVSPNNDWSAVRVWHTPGRKLGSGIYPTYGFIYPKQATQYATVANANIRRRPSTRADRITTVPSRTLLEVIEKVAGIPWYRVAHRGRILGYVYAPLVEPVG